MINQELCHFLKLNNSRPIIELENTSIVYHTNGVDVTSIANITLRIPQQETLGLVGESGSGKSTIGLSLVDSLAPNAHITQGIIRLFGRDLKTFSGVEKILVKKHLIKVVEADTKNRFDPRRTIGQQLKHFLNHKPIKEFKNFLTEWDFEDPEQILKAYPRALTQLKKQRLSLALAFYASPELLVLDEPTRYLDITSAADTLKLIQKNLVKRPISILFLSHHLGIVSRMCENIALMYSGEIVEFGKTKDVFKHMGHPYTQGLFQSIPLSGTDKNFWPITPMIGSLASKHSIQPDGCSFVKRCPHSLPGICDYGSIEMHDGMATDHQIRCRRWQKIQNIKNLTASERRDRIDIGPIILSISGLTKEYSPTEPAANSGINFDVRQAETLAIVGETGSGKTTVAKLLLGLDTATDGSIRLSGQEIAKAYICKRTQSQRQNLQAIFTDFRWTLNPELTVKQQLIRTIEKFRDEFNVVKQHRIIEEYLEKAELDLDISNQKTSDLSDEECQILGILRAFISGAKIIIADEPLYELDASVQARLAQLIAQLQREQKTTLIYISSDLSFVRYFADTVAIMYRGMMMEYGDVNQVFQEPLHPYTEALLAASPIPDTTKDSRVLLHGEIYPCTREILTHSCPFHTRCHKSVKGLCDKKIPPLQTLNRHHNMLCHLAPEDLTQHNMQK